MNDNNILGYNVCELKINSGPEHAVNAVAVCYGRKDRKPQNTYPVNKISTFKTQTLNGICLKVIICTPGSLHIKITL